MHEGKTLEEPLNECNVTKIDGKHTSGNVALIKSREDEDKDKDDGQRRLIHTSSVIVPSGKIQVHVLAVIRATVVPPRHPVSGRQLSTPLGFVEVQAISEER
jgi:hypothetical protein